MVMLLRRMMMRMISSLSLRRGRGGAELGRGRRKKEGGHAVPLLMMVMGGLLSIYLLIYLQKRNEQEKAGKDGNGRVGGMMRLRRREGGLAPTYLPG